MTRPTWIDDPPERAVVTVLCASCFWLSFAVTGTWVFPVCLGSATMPAKAAGGLIAAAAMFSGFVYWLSISLDRDPVKDIGWSTVAVLGIGCAAVVAWLVLWMVTHALLGGGAASSFGG